ncbi:MAG TPA: outer membrane protein, partial [Bradyrhizobium sp.]|nr:outer membrane protein [Bradyrhizobium sp.]
TSFRRELPLLAAQSKFHRVPQSSAIQALWHLDCDGNVTENFRCRHTGTILITHRSDKSWVSMEVGMRRVLFSAIGLLALSATCVSAADIPRPAYKAPAVYAPVFTWTGGYIGINAGYGWGRSDFGFLGGDADPSGAVAGLTLGYNWQAMGSPWVFGIEGDINWSDIRGGFVSAACPFGCETRNEWFGTARGRVGYAVDRVMLYATGGLAFGEVSTTFNGFGGASETNLGWTLGGGIEGAIAPNWTAKLEYLYVDLGDAGCGVLACAGTNIDFSTHIVRAGLNYKF